jgi:predicted GNAT family N-acyltransferase
MNLQTRPTVSEEELEAALKLRERVFCEEQGVPRQHEIGAREKEATHLIAIQGHEVVGTCRLIFQPDEVRLGRLAVERQLRRRGIATRLLHEAERQARAASAKRIVLNAQTQARQLYLAAGYRECAGIFTEVGIEHVAMEKSLA